MERGNNGEIRQNTMTILEIGDWHYQNYYVRAEIISSLQYAEDVMMPMQVALRNGDQIVVAGSFYVTGDIHDHPDCPHSGLARLRLRPAREYPLLIREIMK